MTRLLCTVLLSLASAHAQAVVSARAGVVYAIQGIVTIDSQPVTASPDVPLPQLEPGQVLFSTNGHAEILLGQDAVLWTGNNTQIRFDVADPDSPRVTLIAGAAIVEIKHTRSGRHVTIGMGRPTPEITAAGVYRFDRNPDKIRVWSGSLTPNHPFDKNDKDDLHYFAAFRSLALEQESGKFEHWQCDPPHQLGCPNAFGVLRHTGFDLDMPLPVGAARAKYMVASEAGLVNGAHGPYRLGLNSIESGDRRVELFLGLGITVRLNQHSRLHLLDTKAIAPVVALEAGEVMIEVAKSADKTHLSLYLGNTVTEIHKPGLYRFDLSSPSRSHAVAITDHKNPDEFFAWNRTRSLTLWESDASFMTDWGFQGRGTARHKQYGDASTTKPYPLDVLIGAPRTGNAGTAEGTLMRGRR